jgi:hypothetical protein
MTPGPGILSLEEQLKRIPELSLIMTDPKYEKNRRSLLGMKMEDIQQMSELLYHGQVVHFEDYERFQEAAVPYDMESYSKRREIHRMMQMMSYRDLTQTDWMKWVVIMGVLLILGAIAYTVFAGGGG